MNGPAPAPEESRGLRQGRVPATYLPRPPLGRGMAEDRPIVLYPAYFDLKRSRQEGRRVPKSLAVDGPTAEEIEKAAKALVSARRWSRTRRIRPPTGGRKVGSS